jgi:hypothetical protein
MDEGDQKRQLIDGQTEGTGRLRGGVESARAGVDRARLAVERVRLGVERRRPGADADGLDPARDGSGRTLPNIGRARDVAEDGAWFLREHVAWPVEDRIERLGRRGAIGVFGGGGIAVAGVVAALVIAGSGGSGQSAGTTEAFVTPQRSPAPVPATVDPTPAPKKKATKPAGPTLHGAPPDFSPARDVHAGVSDGKALGGKQGGGEPSSRRGTSDANGGDAAGATTGGAAAGRTASADDTPASTAKIGATPAASASAQAQADDVATASSAGVAETGTGANGAGSGNGGANDTGAQGLSGPPAPKAAKKVARRFAEAFVVYEVGGIDTKVRKTFNQTSTKQLSRSLLHRPPRQPASVKVPRAKVVNVVAGPSKGKVYSVSVSLLRVGVTSELRLEMERGVGKKWQVTNVFG